MFASSLWPGYPDLTEAFDNLFKFHKVQAET